MDLDGWESRTRAIGGLLAALGLLAAILAGIMLVLTGTRLAAQIAIAGLICGLVGSLLLLAAPDTLPPREREP